MSDKIVVLDKDQFVDIIYNTVNRCLEERNFEASANASTEEDGYYTREDLRNLLHISYSSIDRRQSDGILKCKKVGRRNLYSKSEVHELLREGKLAKYLHNRKN